MPPDDNDPLHALFHDLEQAINEKRRKVDRSLGLRYRAQRRLLFLLHAMPGVGQKELIAILDIRPASMSELVRKLVERGLVHRKRGDRDKRRVDLSLTPTGQAIVARAQNRHHEVLEEIFGALSKDERQQLCGLLEKSLGGSVV